MYRIILENHRGERLQLSQNPDYTITRIDGLNPPKSSINTAVNANFDGSSFKSSRVESRNIVIELAIEGNVEENRIKLYKYIKLKKQCKFYYKNASRDVSIVGYVESFEIGFFDTKEMAQISIICPSPFFIDEVETDMGFSYVEPMFEFPFSIPEAGIEFSRLIPISELNIYNEGDVETGILITYTAIGSVSNPTIYQVDLDEHLKVNVSMEAGDRLIIDTNKGMKKIILKKNNGIEINELNNMTADSTWIYLESGDNTMIYTADDYPENLTCDIVYNNLYEGV